MKPHSLTNDFLNALAGTLPPLRLSLYQPTHRHHPGNQQDPIRFRNMVKEMEQLIRQNYPAAEMASLLEPFESLGRDHDFWNHTLDGLAVFGAPGWFQVFGLPRPVRELVVVAGNFHTKPLRRFLQSASSPQRKHRPGAAVLVPEK